MVEVAGRSPTAVPESAAPRLRLEIAPGAGAGAAARRALAGLHAEAERVLLEQAGVLVAELLAGARSLAGDGDGETASVELRVWVSPTGVRAEVCGHGCGESPLAGALARDLDGPCGRGLHLLERLADRWGVRPGAPPTLWFELDRRRGGGPPAARLLH